VRVVQVCPRYRPRDGGVETHVAELSERLAARGHEVTVHTADAGPDVAREETRAGVRVRRHHGLAPGGAFHVAPGLLPAVRRADADVVHAHNYHSTPLVLAAAAAGDAAFVATPHYHGGSASRLRDLLLVPYRLPGGWALRRADRVLAVSGWERGRLREAFGVDARVVPNGLDVARFREATPETRERPYLLSVGRLEPYKGVDDAVRALAALDGYDLLVAGSGPDRERLERVAGEAGVAERVDFLGYVSDDRLPGLYAGAAAFLTLSTFESYGMTVAEALAAGTPCVVRESGALTDWTTREGCVGVETPTPERVAGAVREALGRRVDPSDLPSWDEVCDRVAAEYRNVLSGGGDVRA
jgi:glycosyltransferase involved in cell wall biosynthesis